MKAFSHLWQYRTDFLLEWKMLKIKVVEKIKIFSSENPVVCENVEKYGGARGRRQNSACALHAV